MNVWSGEAGEIATGTVADDDGHVVEAWTGPQVAWKMARGRPGAFGGKLLTSWPVWVGLSAIFLLGLADLRRPLSMRTVDLLVLLSFGVSLAFFNRGGLPERRARRSAARLPGRANRMDRLPATARPGSTAAVWPVWALAVATLFLVGFRVGLNVDNGRSVIDVGYAGVIGGDRILDGEGPTRHDAGRRRKPAAGPTPTAGYESGSRRTVAASRRIRVGTPTGPSPIASPAAVLARVERALRTSCPLLARPR